MILGALVEPYILGDNFFSPKNVVYGAYIASRELFKAILRYSNFKEVHFFSLSSQERLVKTNQEFSGFKNLKLLPRSSLPQYLAKEKYQVFFQASPFITDLVNLRSRFANCVFPVCGYTHTISYPYLLKEIMVANYFSQATSFDSLICSSEAARLALKKIDLLLRKRMQLEFGLQLKRRYRLDCLPLGIEADDYGVIGRFKARRDLGIHFKKTVILYFGRFSRYDKMVLEPLLPVYKKILQKKKDVLFIFAGSSFQDRYGIELKKIAKGLGLLKDIHFYFNPSEAKKKTLYAASDIFVSPSDNIQESFGLTLLEAMASGLAVLASDWNGYRDIISHGRDGFLIPTLWADCLDGISSTSDIFNKWQRDHFLLAHSVCVDMQKMRNYLEILINNKVLRATLASAAQKKIKEIYNWKALIPRYERLWKDLYLLSQKSTEFSRAKANLFSPDYFYCFGHYAKETLKEKYKLAVTAEGVNIMNRLREVEVSEFFRGIFSWRIAFVILDYLKQNKEGSVFDVVTKVKKFFYKIGVSGETIIYHIQWLLKNNYLRVIS